ncbi:MAG TPA: hypothetical protein VFT91_02440 [Dehalococcoidia bacterium]|nr:hypothetical protein [Dehalococcoidia bacterium]
MQDPNDDDWQLVADVEIHADWLREYVDRRLGQRQEWDCLPEHSRKWLREADVLLVAVSEDYGPVVVNYGRAVEELLRHVTALDWNLNQFARAFRKTPQFSKAYFADSFPLDRASQAVDVINRLRNQSAHAGNMMNSHDASKARQIIWGSPEPSADGLLSILLKYR